MTTLEDLIKGTGVGNYVGLVYGVLTVLMSAFFLNIQWDQYQQNVQRSALLISKEYGISLESSNGVICHQGILHYKAIGLVPSYSAFSPNIQCSSDAFKSMTENPAIERIHVGMIFLFFGIISIGLSTARIFDSENKLSLSERPRN
ncbi:hypothetical protein [Thiomicrospira sp. S5]|uniref:hypothetical protein n=1 Tax=Thiomicrospira sp. S5 TaxID=1803865 RepID=UPI0004A6C617|nr:hypothetical protein [Thiomicrospira sp. S5]